MTTTNAATTQTQEQAPAKALTKMDHARVLFAEIYTAGYKFRIPNAKSQRNEFIKRAINEFGMTQAGAATYFQNLTNEAKGEPVYKYNKTKGKGKTTTTEAGAATGALNETTNQAGAALPGDQNKDQSAEAGAIGKFRWMVQNAAGEELSSHPTRSEAQAKAKELGCDWADRKAQAPAAAE
ncbi:hypothetical protein D3C75_437240 [compost metagenome]